MNESIEAADTPAKRIVLSRFMHDPHFGTLGKMQIAGRTIYTMERPWEYNRPYKSCIPLGEYWCTKDKTTTSVPDCMRGQTWYLTGESVVRSPEDRNDRATRFGVCIHIGNYVNDVQGCLSPGLSLSVTGGSEIWMVRHSRKAMIHLNESLPDEFLLEIDFPNPYEHKS